MKIKPEERPKAIVLGLAIVMVLCLFGFTVVPRLLPHGPNGELLIGASASATRPPSTVATANPTASPAATAASTTVTPGSTGMAAPILTGSVTAVDPFWRPFALSHLPGRQTAAPPPKPVATPSTASTPGSGGFAKGGGVVHLPDGRIKVMPMAPPPLPDVELQGIVQDETAIAVLSVGGKAQFLKAGQALGAGWIVYRIQAATVILKQGPRQVSLNLGQTMAKDPAQTPKEIPQENPGTSRVAETLPPFHNVMLQP